MRACGLTAVVLGIHGLAGLEEGVHEEGLVVGIHLLEAQVQLGAGGQVRAEGRQGDELHQLHVGDVAETAVIRVCTAHLPVNQSHITSGDTFHLPVN